jgi:hypothetical protein
MSERMTTLVHAVLSVAMSAGCLVAMVCAMFGWTPSPNTVAVVAFFGAAVASSGRALWLLSLPEHER